MIKSENERLLPNQFCSMKSSYSSISQDKADIESSVESNERKETSKVTILEASNSFSWLGYIFCILSGLCFIACNVCTKYASSEFPVSSWQMLFVRCIVQNFAILPVLCWTKSSVFGPPDIKTRLRLFAQATITGFLLFCSFEGIRRLPLGDFGAIAFSSPAFTMVLSIFLLKDHCGLFRVMIAIILTVGVVMISRPPAIFPSDVKVLEPVAVNVVANIGVNVSTSSTYHLKKSSTDVLGIVFALSSSMLSAWVTILARQVNHIHYSVQVFWGAVGGVTISMFGMFLIDNSSVPLFEFWTVRTCLLAVGQAFLGLCGTIFILKALKWISPTKNKVIRSFQVVGSYIIQVAAFGTIPHVSDYIGAVLIVLAVLGITMEDNIIKLFKLRSKYF